MSLVNCPTCGKWGYESDEILRQVRSLDWYEIVWQCEGDEITSDNGMTVKIVACSDDQDRDSYGELIGDDFFVVVQIPDGRCFRRDGWRDSYGGVDWRHEIREVRPEPRIVTIYDYI